MSEAVNGGPSVPLSSLAVDERLYVFIRASVGEVRHPGV